MATSAPGVIKKHRVRQAPAGAVPVAVPTDGAASAAQAEVRLVRKEVDHAVLEVSCPCGNIIHVECRWEVPTAVGQADAPEPPDAPQPNKEATQ
ncbi:MAG: hypothetical protein R6X20_14385 [Phycisphaerae bacterium]